jgi:hypothetical protein
MDIGREPLLRDVAVAGGRATRIWQGQLNAAGVGIEIAEVVLDQNPTPPRMRQAWLAQRAGQARPVIVFASVGPDQALLSQEVSGLPRMPPRARRLVAETIRGSGLGHYSVRDRSAAAGRQPGNGKAEAG